MPSQRYRSIAMVCGAAWLAIVPAGDTAQLATAPPTADLQVEDVRAALSQLGYAVEGFGGSADGRAQIVEARAPAGPEIVRALVFADRTAAAATHEQAILMGDG